MCSHIRVSKRGFHPFFALLRLPPYPLNLGSFSAISSGEKRPELTEQAGSQSRGPQGWRRRDRKNSFWSRSVSLSFSSTPVAVPCRLFLMACVCFFTVKDALLPLTYSSSSSSCSCFQTQRCTYVASCVWQDKTALSLVLLRSKWKAPS